jgi:hypothetical protein
MATFSLQMCLTVRSVYRERERERGNIYINNININILYFVHFYLVVIYFRFLQETYVSCLRYV